MGFGKALALSLAVHAVAYAGGLGWMAWRERADDGVDIDLAHSSLLPLPPHMGLARPVREEPDWVMDTGKKFAPRPVAQAATATAQVPDEEAGPPCPPPCPSNQGDWAPASTALRRPEWTDGMISESDYPTEARYKNQTGKVVAEVLLDAEGHVRSVQLLQGSYESLNEKTLEKLRQARFSPCVDGNGRPFPCRMRLPIVWSLE